MQNISPQMTKPRDKAGNAEEEEGEGKKIQLQVRRVSPPTSGSVWQEARYDVGRFAR